MHFLHLIPAVFAVTATAAKFERFVDKSCQKYGGAYVKVTAAEQEKIVQAAYAGTASVPEASRGLWTAIPEDRCPSNSDDTYKWIDIPQWQEGSAWTGGNRGGAIAVIYYKETDTYLACRYLSGTQANGYQGNCN